MAAAFFSSSCDPSGSNRSPQTAADYSATETAIYLRDCIKKKILPSDLFRAEKNYRIF
jgi:hypothetical protein